MANYHFHADLIGRNAGQSIVDRTAYIMRTRLYDSYTGRTYDRRSRNACVLDSGVCLPVDAPQEYEDVQTLLTSLNSAERRVDAQMARSYHLSLPIELTPEQQVALAKEFVDRQFTSIGQCAVFAIHLNSAEESGRANLGSLTSVTVIKDNPHLHLIVPFRMVDSSGFQRTKIASRATNNPKYLGMLRKDWADVQNQIFKHLGLEIRVSHESLAMQGIHRVPAPYLGVTTLALERKGITTERGEQYRNVITENERFHWIDRNAERSYEPTR